MSNPKHGASADAIQFHYDLGNEFYRLWLDSTLNYSGALFEDGDSLERAQERKLDYHLTQSCVTGTDRLLDIGCGWGALLKRAVEKHQVKKAEGLTLSAAQRDWVASFKDARISVDLRSWADFEPTELFDAIVSVGAFEHFGTLDQTNEEKIENYRDFFEHCHGWLKPGGRISLQTFAYGTVRPRETGQKTDATQFLARKIFPETDPPRLSDIAESLQGTFEIERLRNDRMDYVRTLKEWIKRLRKKREQALEFVSEEVLLDYEHYLKISLIGFDVGHLDLYRITLRRIGSR